MLKWLGVTRARDPPPVPCVLNLSYGCNVVCDIRIPQMEW